MDNFKFLSTQKLFGNAYIYDTTWASQVAQVVKNLLVHAGDARERCACSVTQLCLTLQSHGL